MTLLAGKSANPNAVVVLTLAIASSTSAPETTLPNTDFRNFGLLFKLIHFVATFGKIINNRHAIFNNFLIDRNLADKAFAEIAIIFIFFSINTINFFSRRQFC